MDIETTVDDAYSEDFHVTKAMMTYGGGFVQQLGQLWQRGDNVNRAKLKAAFPEYWRDYAKLARIHAKIEQEVSHD
jgi:hypothetical protein